MARSLSTTLGMSVCNDNRTDHDKKFPAFDIIVGRMTTIKLKVIFYCQKN